MNLQCKFRLCNHHSPSAEKYCSLACKVDHSFEVGKPIRFLRVNKKERLANLGDRSGAFSKVSILEELGDESHTMGDGIIRYRLPRPRPPSILYLEEMLRLNKNVLLGTAEDLSSYFLVFRGGECFINGVEFEECCNCGEPTISITYVGESDDPWCHHCRKSMREDEDEWPPIDDYTGKPEEVE